MTITIKEFKAHCLDLLRQVEEHGEAIEITRQGRVVARVVAPAASATPNEKPWERLRGSGVLVAAADESVLSESEFDAVR